MSKSSQTDMFSVPMDSTGRLVLKLHRIPAPRTLAQKERKSTKPLPPNYHIPSFKNAKQWITKLPNGKPLKRPFLITSPEFQKWMDRAVQSLESQCISKCLTEAGETQLVPSKLFAMLSRLPADDSVNDLVEGVWKVIRVPPGEEGAIIVIERL